MKKQLHPTERIINTEGPSQDFSSTMKLFLLMSFALFSIISTQGLYEKYDVVEVMEGYPDFTNPWQTDPRIWVFQFFKRRGKKADIKKNMSIKSCLRDCGPKPRRDCLEKCKRKYECRIHGNFKWARTHYFDCYELEKGALLDGRGR